MAQEKFLEVQCLRKRCIKVNASGTMTLYWDPFNEGSYLDIVATDTTTTTLDFTFPVVSNLTSPSGLEIWVVFAKAGGAAGAGITWPGDFRFQTVGDKLPNPNEDSVTYWRGFVRPGDVSIYMTKIGEWVGGGA